MTALASFLPQFGDDVALRQFIDEHELEHKIIGDRLALFGISTTSVPLFGEVTGDWFMRHAQMHYDIENAIGMTGYDPLEGAAEGGSWDTPDTFDAWMQDHFLRHQEIAQILEAS